jgi:hypothetical protein
MTTEGEMLRSIKPRVFVAAWLVCGVMFGHPVEPRAEGLSSAERLASKITEIRARIAPEKGPALTKRALVTPHFRGKQGIPFPEHSRAVTAEKPQYPKIDPREYIEAANRAFARERGAPRVTVTPPRRCSETESASHSTSRTSLPRGLVYDTVWGFEDQLESLAPEERSSGTTYEVVSAKNPTALLNLQRESIECLPFRIIVRDGQEYRLRGSDALRLPRNLR